jgi:hypothetical protein
MRLRTGAPARRRRRPSPGRPGGAAGQQLGRSTEARGRVQGGHVRAVTRGQEAGGAADSGADIEHTVPRSDARELGQGHRGGAPERVKLVKPSEIVDLECGRIKSRRAERLKQVVDDLRPDDRRRRPRGQRLSRDDLQGVRLQARIVGRCSDGIGPWRHRIHAAAPPAGDRRDPSRAGPQAPASDVRRPPRLKAPRDPGRDGSGGVCEPGRASAGAR